MEKTCIEEQEKQARNKKENRARRPVRTLASPCRRAERHERCKRNFGEYRKLQDSRYMSQEKFAMDRIEGSGKPVSRCCALP
jgi:hypothetical protein